MLKWYVRNRQTRQIWHGATQLSVIPISDAALKVPYLITTAVEALDCGDVEQKIHLKSTQKGVNHDVTLNKHASGPCRQKIAHSPIFKCCEFFIRFKVEPHTLFIKPFSCSGRGPFAISWSLKILPVDSQEAGIVKLKGTVQLLCLVKLDEKDCKYGDD